VSSGVVFWYVQPATGPHPQTAYSDSFWFILVAFLQGDTSSQSEPGRYLQAVQALCSRYYAGDLAAPEAAAGSSVRHVLPVLPLVINTPGWITGLGLELLAEVLRCAAPTHGERSATSKSHIFKRPRL
jgi:hypothetical protein